MYHGNLAASLAGLFTAKRVPVLWNVRQSLATLDAEKPLTAIIIRLCARFSAKTARVIYNSYTAARQHEELGYRSAKTAIISNGFNIQIFKPDSDARVLIRRELRVREESMLIGLVARYHPMKDHETFLQAAALLSQVYPTIYFVLVGDGVDESNPKLSELVEKFNLKARVLMLGGRKDIPKINAALDVAVNVSWRGEAFSNSLGEAMACGIPCVVTDVGDSAWVLGETGKVIPARNSEALSTAIQELLDAGLQSRQMLGTLARQRVKENFSIEYVAKQYSTLYEQCVSEGKFLL